MNSLVYLFPILSYCDSVMRKLAFVAIKFIFFLLVSLSNGVVLQLHDPETDS